MKILLSKGSIAKIALLMLLSLNAFAGMTILVNAPAAKDSNVLISGSGSVELTWKSGKSKTYYSSAYASLGGLVTIAITPTNGWHISAFLIDGTPQDIVDEDGFTFTLEVRVKREVSVTFLPNGGVDDVDPEDRDAYPDPEVGVIFDQVTESGEVYAYTIGLPPPGPIGDSWNVTTTLEDAGRLLIILILNMTAWGIDEETALSLRVWKTEVVPGDVDLDGIVTGDDVSAIANVNPGDPVNPLYDLNDDGIVDNDDVEIASHNLGEESVWKELEQPWPNEVIGDLVYVCGVTDGLSIFGVH